MKEEPSVCDTRRALCSDEPAGGCPAGDTGRPLIAILMAVYEPRLDWLEEQLRSLDRQMILEQSDGMKRPRSNLTSESGCPVKLYIRDDASKTVSRKAIRECVENCVSGIPVDLCFNEFNEGSNAVFERLTRDAEGVWFAYCDQDDIWEPDKLEKELKLAQEKNAALVCSDLRMIDGDAHVLADSVTDLRPRHRFAEGTGLAGQLIYRNFVVGSTILMRADLAKQALPFADSMVHDHYLAFFSALNGGIAVCREPLVKYRRHEGNQTGVLYRIHSKQEYIDVHLGAFAARSRELFERFAGQEPELETAERWREARERNAAGTPGGMRELWKLRSVNPSTSWFELIGLRMPDFLFRATLKWIQAGRI